MTSRIVSGILLLVGLIHLYPGIGVLSAGRVATLYGLAPIDGDLAILMRHRAVLLGLLGATLVVAAFRRRWQGPASGIGLISAASFVALAYAGGPFGDALRPVVVADVASSIGLVVVLGLLRRDGD